MTTNERADCIEFIYHDVQNTTNSFSDVYFKTSYTESSNRARAILVGTYNITPTDVRMVSTNATNASTNGNYNNYNFEYVGNQYQINKKNMTITFNGGSKIYDGNGIYFDKDDFTFAGRQSKDTVAQEVFYSVDDVFRSLMYSYVIIDAGTYSISLVDSAGFEIDNSENVNASGVVDGNINYNFTFVAADYVIYKKQVWICLIDSGKVYDGVKVSFAGTGESDRLFAVSTDSTCNSQDTSLLINTTYRYETASTILYTTTGGELLIDVGEYWIDVTGMRVSRTQDDSLNIGQYIHRETATANPAVNFNINNETSKYTITKRPISITYIDNHENGALDTDRIYDGEIHVFSNVHNYDVTGEYIDLASTRVCEGLYLVSTPDRVDCLDSLSYKVANITNSKSEVYAANVNNGTVNGEAVLAGTYKVKPYTITLKSSDPTNTAALWNNHNQRQDC